MRVFVSGIGLISPLGIGREYNWEGFLTSKTKVEHIPKRWLQFADFHTDLWAPLPEIDYYEYGLSRTEVLQLDPASLITLISVKEALENSGICFEQKDRKRNSFMLENIDPDKVLVNIGVSFGGGSSFIDAHTHHFASRVRKRLQRLDNDDISDVVHALKCNPRFNPFSVSMILPNMIPASVAMKYSLHGSVMPTVQACSSGTTAIGLAAKQLREGEYEMAVCGGVEYTKDVHGICYYGFDAARTMVNSSSFKDKENVNRPFDEDRSGLLYAEGGAAALILESEEHLEKRAGLPIAEVLGFGETFDAHSIMAPDPGGIQIERMMRKTLDDSGLAPEDIDYINAHGTGTIANDKTESEVIERVFGKEVAINSTKSLIGHTFGASGAIEAAVCALSLRDQQLHPSQNLVNPIADLNFVMDRRETNLKYAFSESFAFGGHNSGLIFKSV